MRKAEVLGLGWVAKKAILASVDFFHVADATLLQIIIAFSVAPKAKEEVGNEFSCGLTVLKILPIQTSNFQAVVKSWAETGTTTDSQDTPSVD